MSQNQEQNNNQIQQDNKQAQSVQDSTTEQPTEKKQTHVKKLEFTDEQKKKSKTIGNYYIGKTIGEGTFGKVKMGYHILTDEPVAIKILEKDRIIDVTDVERVSREIHILKLIRHPHIIQLYEIIETMKHIFLVMEYCSGGEVFDYIVKHTRLQEEEACKFFQEIIGGIEYIHKLKIVHRDLKPENLILDHQNNIKILDFGLSNTYKKSELLKTACGSPCYAAPEMIAGKKYESVFVDIWSSGVILFALLCGYLPFEDQNTSQLYKKILNGEYQIPDWVSKDARDILKKILNTDPETRYNFDDIKKHPWFQKYKRSYAIPPGIIVGYNRIPVDYKILKELEKYKFEIDNAQKCIDANNHNDVTTTYHLLLRKHLNEGGKSEADLNSETFDITLLEPKPRPNKMYYKQAGIQENGSGLQNSQEKVKYTRIRGSNSLHPTNMKQNQNSQSMRKQDQSFDHNTKQYNKRQIQLPQSQKQQQNNQQKQQYPFVYPQTTTNVYQSKRPDSRGKGNGYQNTRQQRSTTQQQQFTSVPGTSKNKQNSNGNGNIPNIMYRPISQEKTYQQNGSNGNYHIQQGRGGSKRKISNQVNGVHENGKHNTTTKKHQKTHSMNIDMLNSNPQKQKQEYDISYSHNQTAILDYSISSSNKNNKKLNSTAIYSSINGKQHNYNNAYRQRGAETVHGFSNYDSFNSNPKQQQQHQQYGNNEVRQKILKNRMKIKM